MLLLPYQVQASRVFTLFVGAFWFFAILRGRALRKPEIAHWAMLLFIVCAAANLPWTPEPERSFRRILSYSQLFLLAVLVHQAARTTRQYHSLLAAYLAGGMVPIAGQFYNFTFGVTTGDGRYTSPGFDPNDLAITLVLGIPIAWHLAVKRRLHTWLASCYIPLAITGCLMTASRGALVTLAVALLYPLTSLPKMRRRSMAAFFLILGGSVCVFLSLKGDIAFHRLATITRELSDRDLNGRVDIWQRGINVFMDNPLLGAGAGNFGSAVGSWRSRDIAAHNTMLGVLVEHGLLGISLFIFTIAALLQRARQGEPGEGRFWILLLASWCVAVSTLSWENRELTWLLWGLCLADPLLSKAYRGLRGRRQVARGYSYVNQKVWA
ncbi:MAG: O-antigen ligase family protein [Bryobacterales bacterium]|nr:O-antigen ligase family protein [Bryobacterales bacterium]